MNPTYHLRYLEVEHEEDTPLCCSYKYYWGEPKYYRLQQLWEDEFGNKVWRFVCTPSSKDYDAEKKDFNDDPFNQ